MNGRGEVDVFGERASHGEVGRGGVGIVRYGATMTGAGEMAVQGMYVMVCQSRVLGICQILYTVRVDV